MIRLEKITDNQWKRRLKGLFPMFTKEKIWKIPKG
jgi:hypothetical protein